MEIDDETRPSEIGDHTGRIVNESAVTNHTDIIDAVVVDLQVINVTEEIQINDAPTVQVSQTGNLDEEAADDLNIRPDTPNGADEADDCKRNKNSDDEIVRIYDENSTLKSIIEAKTNDEDQLKNEISNLKNILKSKESEEALLNAKIQQLQNDYKIKLEHFQESQKDKTSIIMKYAEAEKRCIDLNRTIDTLQTKLQNSQKENKMYTDKCDKLQLEKQKLNENLSGLRQNLDKIKEQNILTDAKLNIVQAKLKFEINSHLETKNLYEKLVSEFEKKSVNDNDDLVNKQMNEKYNDLIEEISTLKDKLNFYENDYKNHESNIAKYTDTLQSQKQLNKDLLTEILQLRELQAVLTKYVDISGKKRQLAFSA
jgi:chromosome segregation ATPase